VGSAHNGNIVNAMTLRTELEREGHIFQTTNDSEVLSHLLAKSRKQDFIAAVEDSVRRLEGSFSILIVKEGLLAGCVIPTGSGRWCWADWAAPGSWPRRPARWTWSAPNTCARWSRASWW
jgi:amidophosphoribosyltransferase